MQLKHLVKTLWRRLLCALVPRAPEVVPFRKATTHKAELQGYQKPHVPEVLERELPRYLERREDLRRRRRKRRERPKRDLRASQRPRINVRIDIDIS